MHTCKLLGAEILNGMLVMQIETNGKKLQLAFDLEKTDWNILQAATDKFVESRTVWFSRN